MRLVILDLDELEKDAEWDEYEDGYTAYSESAIKSALVEAERHGHWVKIETSKFYDCQNTVPIYKCSFCHTPFVNVDLKDRYHYCPNCGALMDLVDQESEK